MQRAVRHDMYTCADMYMCAYVDAYAHYACYVEEDAVSGSALCMCKCVQICICVHMWMHMRIMRAMWRRMR